jgi:phosphoglucosamine mutase
VPQMLKNVKYGAGAAPLEAASVKAIIAAAEVRLAGKGRLLIRKSGTEPLVRVMAECEDEGLLIEVVDGIVAAVQAAV